MVEVMKEIYDSEYGKGYQIFVDGVSTIIQPHAPGLPGLVGMTEEEANVYADEVIERIRTTGGFM
jgi:hypothetical protein